MKNTLALILLLSFAFSAESVTLPANTIQLPTNDKSISLADYRGSVIYLDFWASWCKPCRKSFPWMNEMHARYKDKGLKVLAINVDKDPAEAQRFLEMVTADFTIAYDPKGELPAAFKLKAMPSSYLIDKNGTVVKTHLGFKEEEIADYEMAIRKQLELE
jgi:thiol-disulfide isomerase/thioredoxin